MSNIEKVTKAVSVTSISKSFHSSQSSAGSSEETGLKVKRAGAAFTAVSAPKCKICKKSVYKMEEVLFIGKNIYT
jgi:hypothetical protein